MFPTSSYTLELRYLAEDPTFKIFDFDYKFYVESEKENFEKLFIAHYYFHEIGFETISRFKQRLKTKLDLIYPIYRQLYETELACKDINFMYNKDLIETFERDINATNDTTNTGTTNNTINTDYKESNIENGNASLNLSSGGLTNVNNSLTDNDITTTNDTTHNTNQTESTKLISQGNIGVTSSSDLIIGWRSILQDLTRRIIEEELQDLFMFIY